MIGSLETIERERVALQATLDANKSAKERNRLGQFATPSPLADQILSFSLDILGPVNEVRFLDPAIGTGSFFSALLRQLAPGVGVQAEGYEIDTVFAKAATNLWATTSLQIHRADFTRQHKKRDASDGFNLVVCNPPYVRHHHISSVDKHRLGRASIRTAGIRLSGLAGLYAYFMMLSHKWIAKNGISAWLVPSEFLDVNYGVGIKAYLRHKVSLLRIHRFEALDVQFADALVTSSVVWFRNCTPLDDLSVTLSRGANILTPDSSRSVSLKQLEPAAKWSNLIAGNGSNSSQAPSLGEYFVVKRGIATGANKFFVLTRDRSEELGLPPSVLKPLLPGPRYITQTEIQADKDGFPKVSPELFVIDSNLPETQLRQQFPRLWEYLETGAKDVAERYLCRHREPWYSQEKRAPAPFLCTYIGRSDSPRGTPFRFLLNHSKAVATNVYLMLYPKEVLRAKLGSNRSEHQKVLEILNGITGDLLKNGGRVYGGGLHKLEPKELSAIPVPGLRRYLS